MIVAFQNMLNHLTIKAFNIEKEIRDLASFPDEKYLEIIGEVGFECDRCGKCCTSQYNDHIFLLDDDAKKILEDKGHEFLRPAPYFDLCDHLGRFYVMGYALKTRSDGNCIFYTGHSCEHYDIRPRICMIFPYMLHREPDEEGNIEFRQIGGLDEHGSYHNEINEKTRQEILKTVREYESGFLRQQLEFIKYYENYFNNNHLRVSQQMYDRMMRSYQKGKAIEVYVFYRGGFEKEVISI